MSSIQFDPKIATDLPVGWQRRSNGQAADMFADLLGCLEDLAVLVQSLGDPEAAARINVASERQRQAMGLAHT